MPTAPLSDARCRTAKPGDKPLKLFDGGGLHLWVSPKGSKVWRVAYRLDGKPQTASLGPYPAVSLADARTKRDDLQAALREGKDPRAVRRAEKPSMTLKTAVETYWTGRRDVADGYRDNAMRAIELHVEPRLGARPIGAITREELLEVLLSMDAAGKHVYVRRVRMWLGQVWDWAVELGEAKFNVPALINPQKAFGRRAVEHFAALDLPEVPGLMQRMAMEARLQSVLACLMLAYTWTRTGELRMMTWVELDGDLWRIPKERMKMNRDHLVPLPMQAVAALKELRARSRGSKFVFPAEHRTDRAMSENTVLALLARIGYKGRMTGHGWRSVGSTWANEAGYSPDAIERQLAHAPDDKVRAAYNRAEFLPERRTMLQAWADWLDTITAG